MTLIEDPPSPAVPFDEIRRRIVPSLDRNIIQARWALDRLPHVSFSH
jgi:hypothetical protein